MPSSGLLWVLAAPASMTAKDRSFPARSSVSRTTQTPLVLPLAESSSTSTLPIVALRANYPG